VIDDLGPALDTGREALRRFLIGADDHHELLRTTTDLAVATVAGATAASIVLDLRERPVSVMATDGPASALDELQCAEGSGPCLRALREQVVEHVVVGRDGRWPGFEAEAEAHGVRATISSPLLDENGVRGALNLYSASGFDERAEATARAFGAELAAAAARATVYVDQSAMARQLQEAMDARAEIEQAKGILIARERCSADRAFDILRQASQRQNRKLRDVARELIERYQA
jgi:GAF domain-containing protein